MRPALTSWLLTFAWLTLGCVRAVRTLFAAAPASAAAPAAIPALVPRGPIRVTPLTGSVLWQLAIERGRRIGGRRILGS
jgi:hypothetical protein